jgi:hypothetical protein
MSENPKATCFTVLSARPVPGLLVVGLVAAAAYAGVSLLFDGGIRPVAVGLFAVAFTAVYGLATLYVTRAGGPLTGDSG